MTVFILLTEVSISRLVHVTLIKQSESRADNDTAQSAKMIEKNLRRLRSMVFFYLALGAVLSVAIGAWAVTRLVVRPLSKINSAVSDVADGQLDAKVPIEGSGELIALGVAFNRMTLTLKNQRAELDERLEQLERSSRELKTTQDHLIKAAKLASVGTLAAGVAHEIGNPLAGVLGLLDALDSETDEAIIRQYKELMKKEIRRIDKTIGDLLVYARPHRKGDNIEKPTSSFSQVIEHTLALLKAQKLFDKIQLTVTDGAHGQMAVSGDDLTQLLVNLLLNAASAMDGKGQITIETTAIDDWHPGLSVVGRKAVMISVRDNGPGVPREIATKIFDPFFSTKEPGKGTGLGLAICQSLCERCGGEIILDREYTDGCNFVATLPTG